MTLHPFRLLILLSLLAIAEVTQAQSVTPDLIQSLKDDPRGPYRDIRWYCLDGRINDPKEPCGEVGGVQRARYKDQIVRIGQREHIYLGQILSNTDQTEFWDQKKDHSRAKQYIIEQYLYDNDDGWIQRKSQYYRGATQVEDEEAWGRDFLQWITQEQKVTEDNYFLFQELVRALPHSGDQDALVKIRALSKDLAELNPKFSNWRVKIHGKPQTSDLQGVIDWGKENAKGLSSDQFRILDNLITQMTTQYTGDPTQTISQATAKLKNHQTLKTEINSYVKSLQADGQIDRAAIQGVELMSTLRKAILTDRTEIVAMADVYQAISRYLFSRMSEWKPAELGQQLEKACYMGQMAHSAGYLYDHEWSQIRGELTTGIGENISYDRLSDIYQSIRKTIMWSVSLINMNYQTELDRFGEFEPLTGGFVDDRIRSSVLLPLGDLAGEIQSVLAEHAEWNNHFLGQNISSVQGLNPGYAKGTLHVITKPNFHDQVDPAGIYVFQSPPSDLDPVGGIMSISEGNLVSHLQLLARNLGIPNVSITNELLQKIKSYDGQEVFLAVSDRGGVVFRPADAMTAAEQALFSVKERKDERITVPTDDIVLDGDILLNLRDVRADASGHLCGPKAANLGELKYLFPDKVVEGLVLPFSVFRKHMDQEIPGEGRSYWQFLLDIFADDRATQDSWVLGQMEELRGHIKSMTLMPELVDQIDREFREVLGGEIGKVPVFLRSDTNMEDLPDFTGAGLNLTLFNVLSKEQILQGIKDVWASPYTERSYKWRQKFLLNPENVYPSILIIPSVFVDHSGVVITKDVTLSRPQKITAAFSRGAGGAVDGQKSETYLLDWEGDHVMLSPSRDRYYKTLSEQGGTVQRSASLSEAILTHQNKIDIWNLVAQVERKMPATGMQPPYDIELGFEDEKLWLFQIRPFVENKRALSSNYLSKLNPKMPKNKTFSLTDDVL